MKTYNIDIGVAKMIFKIDERTKTIQYQVVEQLCKGFGLVYSDDKIQVRSDKCPDIICLPSLYSDEPKTCIFLRGTNRHLDNRVVNVERQYFSQVSQKIEYLYKIQKQIKKFATDNVLREVLK